MPNWNPQANEIFLAALEIATPKERADYVELACHGRAELRGAVQDLLRASEQADSFLEAPVTALRPAGSAAQLGQTSLCAVETQDRTAEKVGTLIGPYKLLEQIGEGGMGLVFMAEQQRPVRRLVALKIIKPGMDSRQVIARFEAERQALAMMDHPNIARVLDAGTTETGRPYFVMELVRGHPITEFCDQKRLSVRERLELLIQVCQAVQHAHQKGIIHRDLKPTNVLVTMHDAVAVPKVIDFGIAKALGPALTEHTLHTGYAQLVGTPLYMSPEQAEMNAFGVDTRSDVYSLGVLLYELLTSTTPFDKETLSKAGLDEMRRIIREDEPLRPSARLSTLQFQALSTISAHRNADPRRISTFLRGELDWIVMKALEKDRTRRYESASAFARDIQRYLNQEPVAACPPSAAYRLRKLAQRHRVVLLTSSLIAAALILGTALSLWQAWEATASRNLANDRLKSETQAKQEAEQQRQLAEQQRQSAQEQRQLAEERQKRADANYQRALSAVDQMLQQVGSKELSAVPKMLPIQAQLLQEAIKFYEEMIRERPDDPKVRLQAANACISLSYVYSAQKKYDDGKYLGLRRQSVELLEGICRDFPENTEYVDQLLYAYWALSTSLPEKEGESALRRSLELIDKVVDKNPGYAPYHLNRICVGLGIIVQASNPEEAERLFRRAIAAVESTARHDDISGAHFFLGEFLSGVGRLTEAEPEYRQALSFAEKQYRDQKNSPYVRNFRFRLSEVHEKLGNLLARTGQDQAAEESLRSSLKYAQELQREFSEDGRYQQREQSARSSWLAFLRTHNKTGEAIKLLAETADQMSPSNSLDYERRADLYVELKDHSGAIRDYIRALQLDPNNGTVANKLAKLYTETKQYEQAISLLDKRIEADSGNVNLLLTRAELYAIAVQNDKSLDILKKAKAEFTRTIELAGNQASLLHRIGNVSVVGKCYDEALIAYTRGIQLEPNNGGLYVSRGDVFYRQRDFQRASEDYNRAVELDPKSVDRYIRRGYAQFQLGWHDKALLDFKQALQCRPDLGLGFLSQGFLGTSILANRTSEAFNEGLVELATEAIQLNTESFEPYVIRGDTLALLGRFELALADCEQAIKLAPNPQRVVFQIGDISRNLSKQGKYETAILFAKLALQTLPGNFMAHVAQGEAELGLKRYEQALVCFDEAIALAPQQGWWIRKRRAECNFSLGRNADALADLTKAIELRPNDASNLTWLNLVRVAASPDHTLRNGLLQLADRMIEQTQGSVDAYGARGELNTAFGQLEQARTDLERVLNAGAAGWSVRYKYALLCLHAGDQAAYRGVCAAMLAKFFETTDPNEAHFTAWTCALAPSALDDYSPAIELAKRAVAQEPTNNLHLSGLAAAQLRTGQYKEALATLAKTVDNKPTEKTSSAYGFYLQAIAEHHLKQPDDAGKSLAKANELADQELSRSDQPPAWNRKLTLELLRREASDLLAATDND